MRRLSSPIQRTRYNPAWNMLERQDFPVLEISAGRQPRLGGRKRLPEEKCNSQDQRMAAGYILNPTREFKMEIPDNVTNPSVHNGNRRWRDKAAWAWLSITSKVSNTLLYSSEQAPDSRLRGLWLRELLRLLLGVLLRLLRRLGRLFLLRRRHRTRIGLGGGPGRRPFLRRGLRRTRRRVRLNRTRIGFRGGADRRPLLGRGLRRTRRRVRLNRTRIGFRGGADRRPFLGRGLRRTRRRVRLKPTRGGLPGGAGRG